jgi:hypothetical protein
MTMARSRGWMRMSGLWRAEWLALRARQFFFIAPAAPELSSSDPYLVAEKVNRE